MKRTLLRTASAIVFSALVLSANGAFAAEDKILPNGFKESAWLALTEAERASYNATSSAGSDVRYTVQQSERAMDIYRAQDASKTAASNAIIEARRNATLEQISARAIAAGYSQSSYDDLMIRAAEDIRDAEYAANRDKIALPAIIPTPNVDQRIAAVEAARRDHGASAGGEASPVVNKRTTMDAIASLQQARNPVLTAEQQANKFKSEQSQQAVMSKDIMAHEFNTKILAAAKAAGMSPAEYNPVLKLANDELNAGFEAARKEGPEALAKFGQEVQSKLWAGQFLPLTSKAFELTKAGKPIDDVVALLGKNSAPQSPTITLTLPAEGQTKTFANGGTVDSKGVIRNKNGTPIGTLNDKGEFLDLLSKKPVSDAQKAEWLAAFSGSGAIDGCPAIKAAKSNAEQRTSTVNGGGAYYGGDNNRDLGEDVKKVKARITNAQIK